MQFWQLIAQTSNWMEQLVLQYGYFGIFLLAFIGAVSIFIPIPYTVIVFTLGSLFDPILLALTAGFGAALGEFSGYLLGMYGAKIISKERQRKMEFMVKVFNSWGPLAIFVFALTPLPDDLLFIPLGMMRYRVVKAFVAALAGKIAMNFILAYTGKFTKGVIYDFIKQFYGGESDLIAMSLTALIGVILLIIILVVMFRLDWEKIYHKYVKKEEKKKDENYR
ncbi:MAG: YqaA family protein [Candidatus Bathyarchaeales archaeon]